jgi:hypothetical protein
VETGGDEKKRVYAADESKGESEKEMAKETG